MTPDEIQASLDAGTFFDQLMREVTIRAEQGPRPGTTKLTLVFPPWFDAHIAPESRETIVKAIEAAVPDCLPQT